MGNELPYSPETIFWFMGAVSLAVAFVGIAMFFNYLVRLKVEFRHEVDSTILVAWQRRIQVDRVKGHVVQIEPPSTHPGTVDPEEMIVFALDGDKDPEVWAAQPVRHSALRRDWDFVRVDFSALPTTQAA